MIPAVIRPALVLGFLACWVPQISLAFDLSAPARNALLISQSCLVTPTRICLLEEAVWAALNIVDRSWRAHILTIIGRGTSDSASIEEAARVARSIANERLRAIATAEVAEAQAKLGLTTDATLTFAEALQDATSVLAGIPGNVRPSALVLWPRRRPEPVEPKRLWRSPATLKMWKIEI
jgi:hypothetical protein